MESQGPFLYVGAQSEDQKGRVDFVHGPQTHCPLPGPPKNKGKIFLYRNREEMDQELRSFYFRLEYL